jgi:hypothetical protein
MYLKKIEHKLKSLPVIRKLRNMKKRRSKDLGVANYAHLSNEVLAIVNDLDAPIFPMFGTLLSIVRDKEFNFADDYDFAVVGRENFTTQLIQKVEERGAKLSSVTLIDNEKLVELSFEYKGVNVDIFLLEMNDGMITHLCPHFREQKYIKSFSGKLKIKTYSQYFQISYPKFSLKKDDSFNLLIPDNSETIFERHYGLDWKTPKNSGFIDYKHYDFFDVPSCTIHGKHKDIKKYLIKRNLIG